MTNESRKHLFELLEKYKDKSNKLFEAGKVLTDCVKAKGIICCEACDKKNKCVDYSYYDSCAYQEKLSCQYLAWFVDYLGTTLIRDLNATRDDAETYLRKVAEYERKQHGYIEEHTMLLAEELGIKIK